MEAALRKCLTALEKGGVRYLIVGGVAVVLHGHLRATADLDLVLHLEPEQDLWTLRAAWRDDACVRAEPFDAIELELGLLWADVVLPSEPR